MTEACMGSCFDTRVEERLTPQIAASDYKLWLPQGSGRVRYVMAINKRGAGRYLFFHDNAWRRLAAETGGAMLYCGFEALRVSGNGYGASMLTALGQFARETSHPEIDEAPLVLWGHSMGGRVVQDFVRVCPSRVLTFHIAMRAFATPDVELMVESEESMAVPGLYLMGGEDRKPEDIRIHFERARAGQSPRAWLLIPGEKHWPKGMHQENDTPAAVHWQSWSATNLVLAWTRALVARRLGPAAQPECSGQGLLPVDLSSGWLGDDVTGEVAAFGVFRGDWSRASWFPDESVARTWAERVRKL